MSDYLISAVRIAVWVVVSCAWLLIGFVFWVPFLARMIGQFIGAVLVATYTDGTTWSAERGLQQAITFYARGFQRINRVLQREDGGTYAPGYTSMNWRHFTHFLGNVTFALLFWLTSVFAFAKFGSGQAWPLYASALRPGRLLRSASAVALDSTQRVISVPDSGQRTERSTPPRTRPRRAPVADPR